LFSKKNELNPLKAAIAAPRILLSTKFYVTLAIVDIITVDEECIWCGKWVRRAELVPLPESRRH